MLSFLIEKEFKQILRNGFLPRLIIFMPLMMMLVFPWAANQEIKNSRLTVVDNDRSKLSTRLCSEIGASSYFDITRFSGSYESALEDVESDKSDIILEIPLDFEKNLVEGRGSSVLVSANAVNGTKGTLGASYLMSMISSSTVLGEMSGKVNVNVASAGAAGSGQAAGGSVAAADVVGLGGSDAGTGGLSGGSSLAAAVPSFSISPLYKFNPTLDYKVFMVPALMVMLLTMLCGFLPALNIVGEKEAGTIEQMNVTPVGKFQFIFAKLIPYWIIGAIVLGICLILAWLIYGLVPEGSLLTIAIFAAIYIIVVSGLGLIISNYASTMQQAMFIMFFFMMILLLMSGLFTPVTSMPDWAQYMSMVNPLRYFIEVMRLVYLKGSTFWNLVPQFLTLCLFALALGTWAIISYRKSA